METKVCPKCGIEYPLTSKFWYQSKRYKCGYRTYCKICENEYNRNFYNDDKEKLHEMQRQRNKKWRENNIERVRKAILERVRKWQAKNIEKVKSFSNNRRARILNAEGSHTRYHIQALYGFQEGRCFHCDCELNGKYHVDHWIPLARGGSNWPENLRLLCQFCNCSKKDKMPWEWDGRYINTT